MEKTIQKLIVYYENPFWVGVIEQIKDGKLSVCKITFGAEPKDYEVLDFIQKNYYRLRFSPSVDIVVKKESVNPKRLQREAKRQTLEKGIGTKSQQALQLQHEENKMIRKTVSKEQKEAKKQFLFELRQQKRKEKHRGK